MKTFSERSSHTKISVVNRKKTNVCPFFPGTHAPVQTRMAVSKPGDKYEQEADTISDRIMRASETRETEREIKSGRVDNERIQKRTEERIRRMDGNDQPLNDHAESAIKNKVEGSQPLPNDTRSYMEARFNADFSSVRIHKDTKAAELSNRLGARAFTYRNQIFFSRDQFQPGTSEGKRLIAHELVHTIQQGHSLQGVGRMPVTSTQPSVQRSVIGEILDKFAEKACFIPGFRMFTIVLGINPINMSKVERSPGNILKALIELLPGGAIISQVLDNHGVFNKIADWIEKQVRALGMVGTVFKESLDKFIGSLHASDLAPWNWGDVWLRAKKIFTEPIDKLIAFGKGVVTDILKFVKDAILKPLAALANGIRGYDLLKAILGEDPITGEKVPRNAETLIGGFMKLIGQEEIWENIQKGKAVPRAWAWFQGALSGLIAFARSIPKRIISTLSSLTFVDIITIAGAFGKIAGAFIDIAKEFFGWAFRQVISLLEILFSVVAPGVLPYIAKARQAFEAILKKPVAFVGNLVRAGRLGFQMFCDRILVHLKTALIKWLTGPLGDAGVYIPKSFDLLEIVKLVLSVLGLTWQNIRSKLVKIIPEPVLAGLEKTASILVTLIKDGPAAAWKEIKAELTELKEQLIAKITEMVTVEIVKAATIKLVSMLNPAGAVIQAILAIYNTITFFIQKIKDIAAVVASFIDSVAAIAEGKIENAAKKVEQTMADTLVVVLAFLAKFIGLGNIPEKLVGILKKIRQPIDRGLDKIVAWIGGILSKLSGAVKSAAGKVREWWKQKKPFTTSGGESHEITFTGDEKNPKPAISSKDPKPLEWKLNELKEMANKSDETVREKALAYIKTINLLLRKNPDDDKIVSEFRKLFELFEKEDPVKKPNYIPIGQTLKGDTTGTTVGKSMKIEWLGSEFFKEHPGSPPGSGQNELMKKLVTDPKTSSSSKYIRGHLLNENLGGKGENINLFPITGNANSQHLQSTEKEIKNWVIPQSGQKKRKYAFYEVKVHVREVDLTHADIESNKVDADFNCWVVLKDSSGKDQRSFMTSVESTFKVKEKAKKYDLLGEKK